MKNYDNDIIYQPLRNIQNINFQIQSRRKKPIISSRKKTHTKQDKNISEQILRFPIEKENKKKQQMNKTIGNIRELLQSENQDGNGGILQKERQVSQNSNSMQIQRDQKILINHSQLIKFTQSFAEEKIQYEEEINKLNLELYNKNIRIQTLEESILEMRNDQHRMEDIIEALKIKHERQLNEYQYIQSKNNQEIQKLKDQLIKSQSWIRQENMQNKRLMSIIKVKNQLHKNIQTPSILGFTQIEPISIRDKQELKQEKVQKQNQQSQRKHKSRKIILKKSMHSGRKQKNWQTTKDQDPNYNSFNPEVNLKIAQLTKLIHNRDAQIEQLSKENQRLLKSLNAKPNPQQNSQKSSHNRRQIMLVNKCVFLQRHIQKLMKKLINIENNTLIPTPQILVRMQNSKMTKNIGFNQNIQNHEFKNRKQINNQRCSQQDEEIEDEIFFNQH